MSLNKKDKILLQKVLNNTYDTKKEYLDEIQNIVKYFVDNYSNQRTICSKISTFKRILKKNGWNIVLLKNMTPGRNITREVTRRNRSKFEKRCEVNLTTDVIMEKLNKLANGLLIENCVALFINCGRRMSEVCRGEFMECKNETHKILFKGLKKKRARSKYCENDFVPIDIIQTKDEFMKQYESLKTMRELYKPNSLVNILQKEIKIGLSDIVSKPTSHTTRVIYVNYLYATRNVDKKLYNVFIKDVLHHETLNSSAHYTDIRITKPSPAKNKSPSNNISPK